MVDIKNPKAFLEKNFHSLFHRNYRYFFFGQIISLIGTWMQVMAQAWLVYTITGSPFKLGVVSTMQFLPVFAFSLFAGVLVDRYPKRNILIVTQTVSMLQAFTLFFLVYFGVVQYWHVLILAFFLGCTNSVDMPARQSYVVELVGRKDVVNGVGLNSSIFNLARIVGPAIAGVLMTGIGIAWCFFVNAISFIAVIMALILIQQSVMESKKDRNIVRGYIFKNIRDGLVYIYNNKVLLKTALIVLFVNIVGFNYNVLIPVFSKEVLHLQEKGFGLLLSSLGLGSLIGALSVALRAKPNPRAKILMTSSALMGIGLFVMGFTKIIYLSAIVITLCGIFNLWFFTMANSILQLNSSDEYRGRVMSVYTFAFAGSTPIGNFITGFIAEKLGAGITFISLGAIIVLVILSVNTFMSTIGNRRTSPVP